MNARQNENPQQLPYGPPPGTGLANGGPQTGAPKGGRRRSRGRRSRRKSMKGGILSGDVMGPMGGRRRSRGRRMRGGSLYGFGGGPYVGGDSNALADGTYRVPESTPEDDVQPQTTGGKNDPLVYSHSRQSGGRRRSRKATRKSGKSGKMSPWLQHVMAVKKANPSFSLGDAMKAAKETYKK